MFCHHVSHLTLLKELLEFFDLSGSYKHSTPNAVGDNPSPLLILFVDILKTGS